MIPVEGHKNLYRDEKSVAIINCDSLGYSQYKQRRNQKKAQTVIADEEKVAFFQQAKIMLFLIVF